jgi:diguanylate cyclase (GGDEF)-like protein
VKEYPPQQASHYEWPDRQQRILVVDDDEAICLMLTRALDAGAHVIEMAYGGQEAIDRLGNDSFDLVITDLKMPAIGGVEVLTKAKEMDPLSEVIVITGYASVKSAVEVMKLGAYDYITKPFNLERIRFLVDRALEKRRLLQAAAERDSFERLSQLDGMTEVHNRRGFDQLLAAEISRCRRYARPLSLLMIDLDDLKAINDGHGHQAGDTALREVASTLKRSVRDSDIVARYGGDEFAVILIETSKADAIATANRLRGLMAMPGHLAGRLDGGPPQATTLSIGVSNYPTDAGDMNELVREADRALYAAKANGGNQVKVATP